jgi:hypothetical protein
MSKLPPIPSEQETVQDATHAGRHGAKARAQSSPPSDGDANLNERGDQANMRQNFRPQRAVLDR